MKCFQAQFNLPLKKVFWNKGKARLQFCCCSKRNGNAFLSFGDNQNEIEFAATCFQMIACRKTHTGPQGISFQFPDLHIDLWALPAYMEEWDAILINISALTNIPLTFSN